MEFRRSGQRDERRRRVLIEDARNERLPENSERPDRQQKGPPITAATYSEGARADQQPRITDLLPTRAWTFLVLGLLGASAIAGLETLHATVYLRLSEPFVTTAAGLNLAGTPSLGTWFSGLVFAASAGLAVLIFALRRHRVDDYRGRYRIWVPVAMLLMLASMETSAGLRHFLAVWIDGQVDLAVPHRPDLWWVIVALSLGGLLLVRLLIEMRACRFACFCGIAAAACHGTSASLWGGITELPRELQVMAEQGLLLMGNFLVLYSLLVYARYVFLDAQGQVAPRKRRAGRHSATRGTGKAAEQQEKPNTAEASPRRTRQTSTRTVRVDAAHTVPNGDAKSSVKAKANAGKSSSKSATPVSPPAASTSKAVKDAAATKSTASFEAAVSSRPAEQPSSAGRTQSIEGAAAEVPALDDRGEGASDDHHTGDDRKLSKAERRKLRKETRRHQCIE